MTHVMIDLETLGTNVDSQIISIGAVAFDANGLTEHEFYAELPLLESKNILCTPGTLKFWLEQPPGLLPLKVTKDPTEYFCIILEFYEWLKQFEELTVWANGTKFDLGMLEHLFKSEGLEVPWLHNADRCMRTLRAYAGRIDIPDQGMSHNALADAKWQALYVLAAHDKLGIMLVSY